MFEITTDWSQNGANWTQATASNKWGKAGGDIVSTPCDSFKYDGKLNGWFDFSVTDAIKKMYHNPQKRYGFLIKLTDLNPGSSSETDNQESYFHSTEASDKKLTPQLIVEIENSTSLIYDASKSLSIDKMHIQIKPGIILLQFPTIKSYSIIITTLNGRLMKKIHTSGNNQRMEIQHRFAPGCYMIHLKSKHRQFSQKFLIE